MAPQATFPTNEMRDMQIATIIRSQSNAFPVKTTNQSRYVRTARSEHVTKSSSLRAHSRNGTSLKRFQNSPTHPTQFSNCGRRRMKHSTQKLSLAKFSSSLLVVSRGKSLIFFSYTFLEITKKSHKKITKSQKNHIQKHKKSQIIKKLLKNDKKTHEKSIISQKNHRKNSCKNHTKNHVRYFEK